MAAPALIVIATALVGGYLLLHHLVLMRTRAAADALIAEQRAAFEQIPLLSSAEKQQLRRFLGAAHVARARALGIAILRDRKAARAAIRAAESRLVRVQSNDVFIMDPTMRYGVPYVTARMHRLLVRIGQRFQAALRAHDLPPYRYLITSVLRTRADQAALRGVSTTAAVGVSSHFFGTTADVHYGIFDYVAQRDTLPELSGVYQTRLAYRLRAAYARMGEAYDEKFKALLGRVLLDLQREGQVLVIYERGEPVFHFTLAAPPSSEAAIPPRTHDPFPQ